jgi:orotate phosphoribosyltransferase
VTSAIVVVDREQGGHRNVSEKGVTMHGRCTLSHVRPQAVNQTVNSSRK